MSGWALVGHWAYMVLVGLAAWSAAVLLIGLAVDALTYRPAGRHRSKGTQL